MSIKNLYTDKEKMYQNLNIYSINTKSTIENRITMNLIYRYNNTNIQTIPDGITFNTENNILIVKLEPFNFETDETIQGYFSTNINIPTNINIIDSGLCGLFRYHFVELDDYYFGFVEYHKPSNQFRFYKTDLLDWDAEATIQMTNSLYLKMISTIL